MPILYNPNNMTELPLKHYMERFRAMTPEEIRERTGLEPMAEQIEPVWASADSGAPAVFLLKVVGEEKRITWPDFEDEGWRDKDKILLLRYLIEGSKYGGYGEFVPYRSMPWGDVYDAKFRQRCIDRLTGTFGGNVAAYRKGCEALGGRKLSGSGEGYEIEFMPGLCIRFILWEGDDEFPAAGQILFSDNFPQTFSAEDRVVACEYVLGKLTRAAYQ